MPSSTGNRPLIVTEKVAQQVNIEKQKEKFLENEKLKEKDQTTTNNGGTSEKEHSRSQSSFFSSFLAGGSKKSAEPNVDSKDAEKKNEANNNVWF